MAADPVQYQRFHIPGAVYLPYSAVVQRGRDGVSRPLPRDVLVRLLGALGVSAASHVVLYDDMGGLQAARLFWELERLGHERVSVLDGGLVAWVRDGRKVSAAPATPRAVTYVPNPGARARDNLADRAALARPGQVVLDVRSQEEYQGEPKDPRGGHVPGARFWAWDQAVDVAGGFRLAPAEPLRASLASAGAGGPDAPVVAYCRSGHRAAHTYLVLRALGYQQVRLYAGSMLDYQLDRDAPLRRGNAP